MNYFIINNHANVVFSNGDMIGRNNLTMEEIADLKSAILSNDEEKVREIISPNITAGDNKTVAVKKLLKDIDSLPEGSPFFMKDFNVYMKNFPEVPVPKTVIQMYYSYDGEQERQAVINFWKLLVLNPNTRVRNELPKFLFNNGFHITSEGLIVSFRRAWDRSEENMKLHEYVINEYSRRKLQKKKVNGLYVYEDQHGFFFINDQITDAVTMTFKGALTDLYEEAQNEMHDSKKYYADHSNETHFTVDGDDHYGPVFYQVGKTTSVKRNLCDANSRNSCSKGLHSGVPDYVVSYTSFGNTIFMCLVNPYDVVSSPEDGWCKIRTSAIHILCTIDQAELEGYLTNKASLLDVASSAYHYESMERIFADMNYSPTTEGLTPEEYSVVITERICEQYEQYLEGRNVNFYDDENLDSWYSDEDFEEEETW